MKEFILKLYRDKRVRFLFVGVLNTVVSLAITNLIIFLCGYPVFEEKDNIPYTIYLVATLIGDFIGLIHSYLWNKYFTFRSRGKSLSEIVRFVIVDLMRYALKAGLLALFGLFIKLPFLLTAVVTLVCTIVSYLGHNFFSFAKKKDDATESVAEESEEDK